MRLQDLKQNIFNITNEDTFVDIALGVFKFQSEHNSVYASYIKALNVDGSKITSLEQIPFLPVEFFKQHEVITDHELPTPNSQLTFMSSGTTGVITSKHHVADVSLYDNSFIKAFELFYGKISDYSILALLPSYLEREGSSLVYMADKLIKLSVHKSSGFYLHNYDDLIQTLEQLKQQKQKTILLGVTYALLDLADKGCEPGENCIVMETGGMKGRRPEMVREELHNYLMQKFKVRTIHSEYGMTELLSQAYSEGNGLFNTPPWMRILIRDINDPFSILQKNKTGGVNIIDLANLYSCSFISTKDIGKIHSDNSFEILGRFDNSDIRGCNLMIQ